MASSHLLSKSSFLKGLQCHKALYLYKNYYHLRDAIPKERQAVFNRGHEVGFLARKLFPGGVDASPAKISKFSESVEKTKGLIVNGTQVIYEPAFLHNDVLVALDIIVTSPPTPLQRRGKKTELKWSAYEVKSSAKISSTYILDAALQYWVIKNSGIEISDFFIINLDTKYVRNGALDHEKLFSKTSVMEEIIKKQPFIEENISILKNVLSKSNIPEISIGRHCFEPYDCDFNGYCWREVPKKIVSETGKNDPVVVKKEELKKFLDTLNYPLLFVDFEVMMPAVPLFENTRPFQNIPFQYSIYKKNLTPPLSKGEGEKLHVSFLAEPGTDPRKNFIENFLKDSEGGGSILVYDSFLEKSILNSLKKDFPEYSEKIDQRIERIIDLLIPFKNKILYSDKMNGNYSLKDISSAFLPENKFEKLKINNGRLSMIAYESLLNETDLLKIIETREALEEYSKADTGAMVKIVEVMKKIAEKGKNTGDLVNGNC